MAVYPQTGWGNVKNDKKMQINLVISKKSSIFAAEFVKNDIFT